MTSCRVDRIPSGLQFASGIFDFETKISYPMICGGISESGTVNNRCWKLRKSGDWTPVTAMKYERSHFTLNAINGSVIAVGGKNSMDDGGIRKVETQKIKSEFWNQTINSHYTHVICILELGN